jgi:hypothetical protein
LLKQEFIREFIRECRQLTRIFNLERSQSGRWCFHKTMGTKQKIFNADAKVQRRNDFDDFGPARGLHHMVVALKIRV